MKYVLVFRPEVRDDLSDAYAWYENQQSGLGDEFIDCVDELLNRICMMPESYAIVYRDIRRAVIKRFPYAVYYRVISSRVVVTAIFHGRQVMVIANLTTPMHPTVERLLVVNSRLSAERT